MHGVPRKIRGARAWVGDAPRASAPAPDDDVVAADAPASGSPETGDPVSAGLVLNATSRPSITCVQSVDQSMKKEIHDLAAFCNFIFERRLRPVMLPNAARTGPVVCAEVEPSRTRSHTV